MEYIKFNSQTLMIEELDMSSYNDIYYQCKRCSNVGYDGVELVKGVSDILHVEFRDDEWTAVFSLGHFDGDNFVSVVSWTGYEDDIKS